MVNVKELAREYVKLCMNFMSVWFYPIDKFEEFRKKGEEFDHQIGMLKEELTKLGKEELIEFNREYMKTFREIVSGSHELLKPLIDAISLYPPEEWFSGEAFLKKVNEVTEKYGRITTEQHKLAKSIVDTFTEGEIKEALANSLKWRSEEVLLLASRAAKKKKAKIRGHESCVFIDYEDEESGLSGTIRVG